MEIKFPQAETAHSVGCISYTEHSESISWDQHEGEFWSRDSEPFRQSEALLSPHSALGRHASGFSMSATAVLRRPRKCVEKGNCLGRGVEISRQHFFFPPNFSGNCLTVSLSVSTGSEAILLQAARSMRSPKTEP